MTSIYIYGGEGTFSGLTDFEWESPEIGARHKFMLFLSQEVEGSQNAAAQTELGKFGLSEIDLISGRPVLVESLNDQEMKVFQKHYEEALSEGSSLVWYPQDLRDSDE